MDITNNTSDQRRHRSKMSRPSYILFLLGPPALLGWLAGVGEFGSVAFDSKLAHLGFALFTIIPTWLCYEFFTYVSSQATRRLHWPLWSALAIAVLITTILHAPFTIIRDTLFEPFLAPGSQFFATWPWNFTNQTYTTEAAYNYTVRLAWWLGANGLAIHAFNFSRFGFSSLLARSPDGLATTQPVEPSKNTQTSGIHRLYGRLSPSLGRRIIYMAAQEHYTKVCTDKGAELIYIRFADATALAQTAIHGRRVHRSYWVTEDAVRALEQTGSKLNLIMIDGTPIPVSRSYRQSVRDWYLARS